MGVGKNIGLRLGKDGKSAAWLSRQTGIPATTLRSIISKDTTPSYEKIRTIADALGCSVVDLMPVEYFQEARQKDIEEDDRRYIDRLSVPALKLNDRGRKILLDNAEGMAANKDYTDQEVNRQREIWALDK